VSADSKFSIFLALILINIENVGECPKLVISGVIFIQPVLPARGDRSEKEEEDLVS
jgi:hypothetical protein